MIFTVAVMKTHTHTAASFRWVREFSSPTSMRQVGLHYWDWTGQRDVITGEMGSRVVEAGLQWTGRWDRYVERPERPQPEDIEMVRKNFQTGLKALHKEPPKELHVKIWENALKVKVLQPIWKMARHGNLPFCCFSTQPEILIHTPFFDHWWKTTGETIPDSQKILKLLLRCVKCYIKDKFDISLCYSNNTYVKSVRGWPPGEKKILC